MYNSLLAGAGLPQLPALTGAAKSISSGCSASPRSTASPPKPPATLSNFRPESFFQVRIGRASQTELAYLSAMADLGHGPYRSGDIAAKLGRTGPASVAPTRGRLIEKGLIYSPSYGLTEFAVPHFQGFIQRCFPIQNTS